MYLACAGLVSIVFGMITSYGLCSYFGFVVSPLHNFIPFLLLGLGVDDMFVIVQALDMYDRNAHLRQSSPDQKECNNVKCQDNTNERNIVNGKIYDFRSINDYYLNVVYFIRTKQNSL